MAQDPVADLLRQTAMSPKLRATAWDIFYQTPDAATFAERIKAVPVSQEIKAQLFDLKAAAAPAAEPPGPEIISGSPSGAPPLTPTARGFLGNIGRSGVNLGVGVIETAVNAPQVARGLITAASQPTLTAKLIAEAIKNRYGSYDALLKTAYEDPVGLASDASIILGGAGIAARASGFGKGARAIGRTAEVFNPLAVPAKVVESTGQAIYSAAISPSRRIQRGFPRAIEEGYRRNILPTTRGLTRVEQAIEQSAARTAGLLEQAEAVGAPRVTAAQITPALEKPIRRAGLRVKGGASDDRPALRARQKQLRRELQFGQRLTKANRIKTEMQTLADSAFRAQERGALIKDLDALADQNVAQAYRRAIEVNAAKVGVMQVAESNRQTQALIGLAQALEEATHSPSRLTHLMSTLGAIGGALAGGAPTGLRSYGVGRLATARPIMAASGLLIGKPSKLLRNAQIIRALAVLRAQELSVNGEGTSKQ